MITRFRAQIKEKNDLRKGGEGHTKKWWRWKRIWGEGGEEGV